MKMGKTKRERKIERERILHTLKRIRPKHGGRRKGKRDIEKEKTRV